LAIQLDLSLISKLQKTIFDICVCFSEPMHHGLNSIVVRGYSSSTTIVTRTSGRRKKLHFHPTHNKSDQSTVYLSYNNVGTALKHENCF